MMPKVDEGYLEARRTEILDAAEAVIARKGVHGATLSDIRDEAGVSSGALYHYFKSKEDIIAGIRERALASDEEAYRRARATPSAKEALISLGEAGVALNHGSPENTDARLALMLWSEALVNDRVFRTQMALMGPWSSIAIELVERAVNEGSLRPEADAEALAAVLASLSLGATVLEAWQPGSIGLDRLVATTRALLQGELWQGPGDPR